MSKESEITQLKAALQEEKHANGRLRADIKLKSQDFWRMFSIFHLLILVDLLFLLAHFVSALQWHEPFLLALLSLVISV
jgi:hypothetical protein